MYKFKVAIVSVVMLIVALPVYAAAQKNLPVISSLSPASTTAGTAVLVTVSGSNFTNGSLVMWNSAAQSTTPVNSTTLRFSVTSTMAAVAGTAKVSGYTSGRFGGTSATLSFTINPATTTTTTTTTTTATTTTTTTTPLAITTTSIPMGTTGTAYAATLGASGGTPPYSWSVASGTLPPGVTLSSAGALSGTPTTSGSYSFMASVKDSGASTPQSFTYSTSIAQGAAALAISTASIPVGTAGTAYPTTTLAATGGTAPITWTVATGSTIPAGLALSPTGAISGTPTTAASYSFAVQAKDAANNSATQTYTMTVAAATTTVATGPIFQTGMEPTNPVWDNPFWFPSVEGINTNVSFVHSGSQSLMFHYTICGDSTNAACGGATQDVNLWSSKMISPGLSHFFMRGYVYFKAPENGIQGQGAQRKVMWFGDETAADGSGATWDLILTSFETTAGSPSTISLYLISQGASCYNGGDGSQWSAGIPNAVMTWNTWYEIEVEAQTNSPSTTGTWNGIVRVWLNGTKVFDQSNFRINGNCTTQFDFFSVGRQTNRYNWQAIDEYRYWDDVAIGTSYIP